MKKIKRIGNLDRKIEIIVAIFLGLTALSTGWSGWMESLHSSCQASHFAQANRLASEGHAMINEASQHMTKDMIIWSDIYSANIELKYAEQKGDKAEIEKNTWLVNSLIDNNCSSEFRKAIEWLNTQEDKTSPFENEEFVESYYNEANKKIEESDKLLAQGNLDIKYSDTFGLARVMFSTVLFLLGIVGTFKGMKNRVLLLGISLVCFVVAFVFMCTIPWPADFNIFHFFNS